MLYLKTMIEEEHINTNKILDSSCVYGREKNALCMTAHLGEYDQYDWKSNT